MNVLCETQRLNPTGCYVATTQVPPIVVCEAGNCEKNENAEVSGIPERFTFPQVDKRRRAKAATLKYYYEVHSVPVPLQNVMTNYYNEVHGIPVPPQKIQRTNRRVQDNDTPFSSITLKDLIDYEHSVHGTPTPTKEGCTSIEDIPELYQYADPPFSQLNGNNGSWTNTDDVKGANKAPKNVKKQPAQRPRKVPPQRVPPPMDEVAPVEVKEVKQARKSEQLSGMLCSRAVKNCKRKMHMHRIHLDKPKELTGAKRRMAEKSVICKLSSLVMCINPPGTCMIDEHYHMCKNASAFVDGNSVDITDYNDLVEEAEEDLEVVPDHQPVVPAEEAVPAIEEEPINEEEDRNVEENFNNVPPQGENLNPIPHLPDFDQGFSDSESDNDSVVSGNTNESVDLEMREAIVQENIVIPACQELANPDYKYKPEVNITSDIEKRFKYGHKNRVRIMVVRIGEIEPEESFYKWIVDYIQCFRYAQDKGLNTIDLTEETTIQLTAESQRPRNWVGFFTFAKRLRTFQKEYGANFQNCFTESYMADIFPELANNLTKNHQGGVIDHQGKFINWAMDRLIAHAQECQRLHGFDYFAVENLRTTAHTLNYAFYRLVELSFTVRHQLDGKMPGARREK